MIDVLGWLLVGAAVLCHGIPIAIAAYCFTAPMSEEDLERAEEGFAKGLY
ncbi:hypothetical protein [Rubellicoccus peritrichatus]|uniref:Uncharacterized protein n=1 Tax=Rubellicoccus peritrichatus TaxID=3080537 RepID=A0AAQ3LD34_9BACT|nr:hypothetical protein [Puniceicoccus sp. CR14]WOO43167.1 hypothetical protein RZN69_08680 [Puniceicoccus sp. CR14]